MKKLFIKDKKRFIISITISILLITAITLLVVIRSQNIMKDAKETSAQVVQDESNLEETAMEVDGQAEKEQEENLSESEPQDEEKNDIVEDIKNIDEESTQVDTKKAENKAKENKAQYYIKVNYQANTVTIYTKDNEGEYTNPYKAMVCSTGSATPKSGVYKMSSKYRWLSLFGGVNGQYCSRITGHILFHSVPYLEKKNDTLEYWEYDKLGTTASAGCIRLAVKDAKWIYDNCQAGTYVEFYSSSDPGPLGKPTAQKISSNEECRNWDPTDTAEGNPWATYKEGSSKEDKNTIKNNEITENKVNENSQNVSEDTKNETSSKSNVQNESVTKNNVVSNNTVTENIVTSNNSTKNNTKAGNSTNTNSSISQNNTKDNSKSTISNNTLASNVTNSQKQSNTSNSALNSKSKENKND